MYVYVCLTQAAIGILCFMHITLILSSYTHVWLQEAPTMEYAQVDKSKNKISREKHKVATEYDDTMVESSVTKVSHLKQIT